MLSARLLRPIGQRMHRVLPAASISIHSAALLTPPTTRSFSQTTPTLRKKRDAPSESSSSSSSPQDAAPEDALDFSSLLAAYVPIDAHFKTQLSNIAHGGRFNPDQLGSLSVPVKVDGEDMGTFPLSELAQVVPRSGRTISLLVNDREYIKPIMSAVQSSPEFNQQPQRSEDNDLELTLRVEIQRKDEIKKRVKEVAQQWRDRVRQARAKTDKQLKDWKKNGVVLPDVVKRGEKEVQKIQDKKMKDIDSEETNTMRQLDRH